MLQSFNLKIILGSAIKIYCIQIYKDLDQISFLYDSDI